LGQTRTLRHNKPKQGLNHDMDAYIDALDNRAPNLNIPAIWDP
jgi:hypothetical protein